MAQNLSNFDAVLKEFYIQKIPELVNQKINLKEHFKSKNGASISADGRRVIYPLHVGRNMGTGAIGENGSLPTAGNQSFIDITVPFKYNYGRIEITAQAIKQSATSKGAFEKAVDGEIKRASLDVGREINRQLWLAGKGIFGLVDGAVSGSTSVTVKNPGGVAGTVNTTRYLAPGMIIAFTDGSTISAVRTIVSKTATGIVVDSNVTLTDGLFIVKASTTSVSTLNSTSYNNEVMGILGMIDDGTYASSYFGINRNTYPALKAYKLSLSSTLALSDLQKAYDAADQRGNGVIKTMWGHHSVRRTYLDLLQTFRRYNDVNAKSPDGGFKGASLESEITYAEKPFKVDRDCPYGLIFGVDDSQMFRYYVTEPEWAEEDGRILLRTADRDAYEARFRIFDNYVCDAPNTCFVIANVNSSPEEIVEY